MIFIDKAPDALGGDLVGNSVPREMHTAVMDWPMVQATWTRRAFPPLAFRPPPMSATSPEVHTARHNSGGAEPWYQVSPVRSQLIGQIST